ncbi:30S ribosomal protein S1 [Rickettsiales endosymbiont of Paramecium tredecaurelia]|uniref:30S ribosomal protein S1 n=1 Tax=Candidatus Sarmatiella mevalonica TaxID=2770581 RepID=UPI001924D613|nr:30S ribosomal protein S1 [Candidatus Sarmatiella mevalonica]MBL3284751.1 30S ribosomal protein S1 [Candidatus Sarmatiella mevalonica]
MHPKKRFVNLPFDTSFAQDQNFEDLLNSVSGEHLKEGSVVKGQVVTVDRDAVVVDVGLKNEGRIAIQEFTTGGRTTPVPGDVVDVYIDKLEGRNGRTIISREKALREEYWGTLETMYKNQELVNGVITRRVKGGFSVDLSGVHAFLPGSQVDVRPIDISGMFGVSQAFKILTMDHSTHNIVVSRKSIVEASMQHARGEMLEHVQEGQILEGKVKNITDYGAFIDLGAVDGLLHLTDISWSKIHHPSEVLRIGQDIKVLVIKFDKESGRISLGVKQLDDAPWREIEKLFPVGTKLMGRVSNFTDYGVFVELKDGIEGLVHSREISWTKPDRSYKKMFNIGQSVEVLVLNIDSKDHKISLSIKRCSHNPLQDYVAQHPIGTEVSTKVRKVSENNIFVQLVDGIQGRINRSEIISITGADGDISKHFQKDQLLNTVVLSYDQKDDYVSLGIAGVSSVASPASHACSLDSAEQDREDVQQEIL